LALFDNDYNAIKSLISGASYTDEEIKKTIQTAFREHDYLLDPHGACAYQALAEQLKTDETGLFLETAHPAKFRDTISGIIGKEPEIPVRLQAFMNGKKECLYLDNNFEQLKSFLLNELVRA
jgi:threonine synthase